MKKISFPFLIVALCCSFCCFTACERDFVNPNAASEDQVLKSTDGLIAMINGIRARYTLGGTGGLYLTITANGLTTKELTVLNAGNAAEFQLSTGGTNVTNSNAVIVRLWENLNLIRSDAEKVIANTPTVINDAGTRAGVLAYAHLYKALALGTMVQFWEQGVTQTAENANFASRAEVLQTAITLLEQATDLVKNTPLSSQFTAAVGTDIDLLNTLLALTARYAVMAGDFAKAKAAADLVDLTKMSVFKFDNAAPNPVFRTSFVTNNLYNVVADFGQTGALAPDAGDGRVAFYLTPNAQLGKGFFTADNASIPLYLPGEVILIKAEALARQNSLPQAIEELNKVRTKTTDIYGVNANLQIYTGAVTQDAVLLEIYRQRCIELYMTGLKLDDSRRFGRPGPGDVNAERSRNFYPYALSERQNNPNTPADPAN